MAYNHKTGLIWHNNDRIFIGIPKNASTSIRFFLGIKESKYYKELDAVELDKVKFCVIREPLERLVSGYYEVIKRKDPETTNKKFFSMGESPARFIEFLNELERGFFDAHIEAQCYYITDENNNPYDVNYYFNFHKLSEELNKSGLSKTLEKKNVSSGNKGVLYDYIESNNLMPRISELYKTDFEIFKVVKENDDLSERTNKIKLLLSK